jgi:hypothetical protein
MQPYHQVIQKKLGIDRNGGIVMEDRACPATAAAKITGVGPGDVTHHCPDRRETHLQGEAQFASFAPATVNRTAAPKQHPPRNRTDGLPILIIPHQRIRPPPAQ